MNYKKNPQSSYKNRQKPLDKPEKLPEPINDKIQKRLAQAGYASRRRIEEWIEEGRIVVNGKLAVIGQRISEHDRISIDGEPVELVKSARQRTRVLVYHKPEGQICTRRDPERRPNVFEYLPPLRNSRWVCVGRLDLNTSGLLLLTNDGELANRLMHPRLQFSREYAVRIRGRLSEQTMQQLLKGVDLEDGFARFDEIKLAGESDNNQWVHVIVKEGRNRLVRRLFDSQNCTVSRLMRIRFGKIILPSGLRRGRFTELTAEEIKLLNQVA